MGELEKELTKAFHLAEKTKKAFQVHLKEFLVPTVAYPSGVIGRFFYPAINASAVPSEDELIDLLDRQLPRFCVPYRVRREYAERAEKEIDFDEKEIIFNELRRKARAVFREVETSGEPGALLLFILLETFFDAPQIATKIAFKTAKNMEYHGADNIHVSAVVNADEIELLFGEAKLYKSLTSALEKICESISKYDTPFFGSNEKTLDLKLISENASFCSENDNELRRLLKEFFDPYSEKSLKKKYRHIAFAGFDFSLYSVFAKDKAFDEEKFNAEYMDQINNAVLKFEEKRKAYKLESLAFSLVLLPFRSVEDFREKFLKKIS